jgi:CRP/FNR family cyclic AMP-dependent transcriptional regulator
MNEQRVIQIKKNQILCREGDPANDLYIIQSGKLLVCGLQGSQVTALGHLGKGDYFGEFSFFDRLQRSANVICLEDAELIKIEAKNLNENWPNWLITLLRGMTGKIRHMDHVLSKKGIKKKSGGNSISLSVTEQGHFYQLLKKK